MRIAILWCSIALTLTKFAYADPIISDVKVFSGCPWKEMVVRYTVEGTLDHWCCLFVRVKDKKTNLSYGPYYFDEAEVTPGRHELRWNAHEAFSIRSDSAVFEVGLEDSPQYCVVDLSEGANAVKYPVAYRMNPPVGSFNTDEYKTTKLVLKRIEPGSFGNSPWIITLSKPFYMGIYEVTLRQYMLVTGKKPNYTIDDMYPVETVSYDDIRGSNRGSKWPASNDVDADSFMGLLRKKTGIAFDLPTDSQWEYSCRAGTTTRFYWGFDADDAYFWYEENANGNCQIVGLKKPNAWGLYDMSGNAQEWCLDYYLDGQGYVYSGVNPKGPEYSPSGVPGRVLRGGSSSDSASACYSGSSSRRCQSHDMGYGTDGFRIAMSWE